MNTNYMPWIIFVYDIYPSETYNKNIDMVF